VLGFVVLLHLLNHVVVELLKVAHQGQGDLLVLVGVGVELVDEIHHILHLGAGGLGALLVAFGLVLLHGNQLLRAIGDGNSRRGSGVVEGAAPQFGMQAVIRIHRLTGLEAVAAVGALGVVGGGVQRLLVARAHQALG